MLKSAMEADKTGKLKFGLQLTDVSTIVLWMFFPVRLDITEIPGKFHTSFKPKGCA